MNTTLPLDYRTAMYQLALAFLERHHALYLNGDQALFSRTVAYLRHDHGMDEATANLVAAQAYGEFRSAGGRRHLDLSSSSASVAILTDPANGLTHVVPVATIFRLIIDVPAHRHLRAVH